MILLMGAIDTIRECDLSTSYTAAKQDSKDCGCPQQSLPSTCR